MTGSSTRAPRGQFAGTSTRADDFAVVDPASPERARPTPARVTVAACYVACDIVAGIATTLACGAQSRLTRERQARWRARRAPEAVAGMPRHACHTMMSCTEHCPKSLAHALISDQLPSGAWRHGGRVAATGGRSALSRNARPRWCWRSRGGPPVTSYAVRGGSPRPTSWRTRGSIAWGTFYSVFVIAAATAPSGCVRSLPSGWVAAAPRSSRCHWSGSSSRSRACVVAAVVGT
jgi:hypothetical protein